MDGFPAGGNGPVCKLLGCWHQKVYTPFLWLAGLDVLAGVVGKFLYRETFPTGNIVMGGNIFLSHIGGLENNLASLNKSLEAVFDIFLYDLIFEWVKLTERFNLFPVGGEKVFACLCAVRLCDCRGGE